MSTTLDQRVLDNGMVVLGEPMPQVGSAAFLFMLPCGAAMLPQGADGAGSVIADWVFRGAGDRDSRTLNDALDGLGLHRNTGVTTDHVYLGAAMEASNLLTGLDLYADVILRPRLDAEQFELSRELAVQELLGLDDDPRQKVMISLFEQFYPHPLGRPSIGRLDDLKNLTTDRCAEIVNDRFAAGQTLFTLAGKYDFDAVCRQLERRFASDSRKTETAIQIGNRGQKCVHQPHGGAQVHIGLMTEAPPLPTDDYYNAVTAVSVLSGGMSSRLFTEVREKRGLCYAVGARYHTHRDFAGIRCYAGTTPDKAQQTLDVTIGEFERLHKGIEADEMQRAQAGLKSSLIMQSESTMSRASGMANDYHLLGRVRPIEEIKQRIEETTADTVVGFLNRSRFKDYTVVTIGPATVNMPAGD